MAETNTLERVKGFFKNNFGWIPLRAYIVLTSIFLVGVGLSLAVYFVLAASESHNLHDDFDRNAYRVHSAIAAGVEATLGSIRSSSFFLNSPDDGEVSYTEYVRFTNGPLSQTPSLIGIQWIPEVPNENRTWWERFGNETFPGFKIGQFNDEGVLVNASERAFYYPIFWSNPLKGNEGVMGFDMSTNPRRATVLNEALNTSSPIVDTLQLFEGPLGLIAFMAVPRKVNGVRCWVGAVYIIEDMIMAALQSSRTQEINFALFDQKGSQLIYLLSDKKVKRAPTSPSEIKNQIQYKTDISVGQTSWIFVATPTQSYLKSQKSYFALVLTLVVAAICGAIFLFLVHNLWQHKPGQDEDSESGAL